MNVEIGTEAAQFPEKEYGIFLAVQDGKITETDQDLNPLSKEKSWIRFGDFESA